jgi:methylase of polypeptide subunit release factors
VTEPGFAEVYDAVLRPEWSAPFGRLLLSMFLTLPRTTGWQVLDVACGAGYPTLELARFLGQTSDIAGIDVWNEAIAIARRKANDHGCAMSHFLSPTSWRAVFQTPLSTLSPATWASPVSLTALAHWRRCGGCCVPMGSCC